MDDIDRRCVSFFLSPRLNHSACTIELQLSRPSQVYGIFLKDKDLNSGLVTTQKHSWRFGFLSSFISHCSLPLTGLFACNWGPCPIGHCTCFSRAFRVLLPCAPQYHHGEDPRRNSRCTCTIPSVPQSISRCWCCSHIFLTASTLTQALLPTYMTFWRPQWPVLVNYREQTYQGSKGALEALKSLQCTWPNASDQPVTG